MNPGFLLAWLPLTGVTGRDVPIITFYALLVGFFATSFLVGWTRARRPWLQVGFALLVCGLYATYLVAAGIWAAQCWDCTDGSGEDSRGMGYGIGMVWFGVLTGLCLAGLGFGSAVSLLARRNQSGISA